VHRSTSSRNNYHNATQCSLELIQVHVTSSSITTFPPSLKAIHSTSVVDNAIHFFSFNFYETSPRANFIKYPDMDFLESTSSTIFASMYPINTSLSLPKHKLKLEVPL